MKKLDNKTKNFIFAIVILSIMLVLSIIYNITGGFVLNQEKNAFLEIGDEYVFKINDLGVYSESFCVDGAMLSGDTVKQKIQIKLPDFETANKILRVKITFFNKIVKISGFDTWTIDGDYYVYNDTLYKNQTLGLCEQIEFDHDISLKNNVLYYLNVSVEYINELGLNK